MTTVTTNYTVVGNPTISSDYVLTGTDADNYLNFNNYGTLDTSKSFDIIFKFRTATTGGYYGIFTIGDDSSTSTCITSYSQFGRLYIRVGNNSISYYSADITQDYYYKVSYDSSESKIYSYYSEDGDDWILNQSRNVSSMPTISVANNLIGVYSTRYLIEDMSFLDLSEFKIISDGDTWFKAVQKNYDPIVTATNVYSLNKVFRNKKQITQINCNNVQFVDDDMSFAFANCSNLTRVTNINQNTTNMAYAFAGCNTALYDTGFPSIPNSVNDISGLFAYHTDWTDIPVQAFVNAWSKVPAHLQTNVAGFLDGCTNLSNVPSNTLPNFMTNIAYAFRNCRAMTDMPIITNKITNMFQAFSGCNNLVNANYEIPNSVIDMSETFYNCFNLITPPSMNNASNVVNMSKAFYWCNNMASAPTIPNTVKDLSYAFYVCRNIVNPPVIPNGVSNLNWAFGSMDKMVNPPIIPESVTSLNSTFYSCRGLTTNVPVIPNSVTDLSSTFYYCYNLRTAPVIPNSVTNMYQTFESCSNLTTPPVIPNSVTNLSRAFVGCSNLTTPPVIPNSVTDMNYTFWNCNGLTVTPAIPNSVTNMNYTFADCNKLTTPPVIPNGVTIIQGILANCTSLTSLPDVPDSVIEMNYAFANCQMIKNPPNIGNSVVNMFNAFGYCRNMTTPPIIPNSANNIGSLFYHCVNMTSAPVIPNHITNLYWTFLGCSKITTAPTIPNNVIQLSGTFWSAGFITPPVIPNSVTNMSLTFCQSPNLVTPPVIPDGVTNLYACFESCRNMTSVPAIPNSVIDFSKVFWNCQKITSAPITPASVTNMEYTFSNCKALTGDIFIQSENIIDAINCFYNTTAIKNVYIPFKYANDVNTKTYNSFINAGYTTDGSVCGVYLKDISLVDDSIYTVNVTDNAIYLNTYIGSSTEVVVPMSKTQGE